MQYNHYKNNYAHLTIKFGHSVLYVFHHHFQKNIGKNLDFSVKLFIFASTRKKWMAKANRLSPLDFGP